MPKQNKQNNTKQNKQNKTKIDGSPLSPHTAHYSSVWCNSATRGSPWVPKCKINACYRYLLFVGFKETDGHSSSDHKHEDPSTYGAKIQNNKTKNKIIFLYELKIFHY